MFFCCSRHGVGGPVVGEIDGEYHYNHKQSQLDWQVPVIDTSNKSGSMEFTIAGHPEDFFPVNVSFYSSKTYCDVKVSWKTLDKILLQLWWTFLQRINAPVLMIFYILLNQHSCHARDW